MMRYNYIILLLGFWLSASLSLAQDLSVPFFCGFEDAVEMGQWTLNEFTPDATDKWYVGTATRSEGRQCLYISNDTAQSAKHGVSNNIVMAYRTIKFPEKAAKYNISFDWKTQGGIDKRTKLYVWIGPKAMLEKGFFTDKKGNSYGLKDVLSSSSSLVANWVLAEAMFNKLSTNGIDTLDYLSGSKKWQNVFIKGDGSKPDVSLSLSKTNAKREFVLAFIWVNASHAGDAETLGACVDNLQIASAELKRPMNFQADMHCEDSTVVLTWETSLPFHDIEYRKLGDDRWHIISDIPTTPGLVQTFSFQLKQEGSYDFRVRGYNTTRADISAYTSINNFVFWCPENYAINYIDLTGPNVTCRYSEEDCKTWPDIPEDSIGVIDYGEESMFSRHTVNKIADRYDPFTVGSKNYKGEAVEPLRTIPDGYLASVRLGNWDNWCGRESITYSFVVDSTKQSILIMKYAILLEDPNHDNESFFDLVVLDSLDRRVDPDCGEVSFTVNDARDWNKVDEITYGGKKVKNLLWKDWSSIGLNLGKYHGHRLSIRVTTADCGAGAHAGWAYFVLDCVSAKLETDHDIATSTNVISSTNESYKILLNGRLYIRIIKMDGTISWYDVLGNLVSL